MTPAFENPIEQIDLLRIDGDPGKWGRWRGRVKEATENALFRPVISSDIPPNPAVARPISAVHQA